MGLWSSPVFSPDGRLLATTGGDDIHVWDPATGRELAVLPEHGDVAFHPDGRSLLINSYPRVLYQRPIQVERGATNVTRLDARTPLIAASEFGPFEVSRDGRFLVTFASNLTTVLVFDFVNPSRPLTFGPYSNRLNSAALSPDGRFVAIGTDEGPRVEVRDLNSRQLVAELPMPPGNLSHVAFSPEGRWLEVSGLNEPLYRLYHTGSWKEHLQLSSSAGDHVSALSPDGEIWAIGNPPYNTHLYSTATGRRLAVLEPPHQAPIASLAFSPNGATLAVMQRDSVVQLWDLRRIRQHLAALNLDLDLAPSGPVMQEVQTRPARVEIAEGPATQQRRALLAREIPARASDTPPRLIDLSAWYNAALTESWHERNAGNDLRELKPELQELAGTLFDVRGLIQLGSIVPDELGYPWEVHGMHVNQACAQLHFLHSAIFAGQTPAGTQIGVYVIHYADGRYKLVYINVGRDLLDWWSQPQETFTNAVVAWTGQNEKSRKAGRQIRLYKTTWKNPFPSVPIVRIDFIGPFGNDSARPFLVAITAD
jgi:WD40 repeat protein